ncbi:MAG: hypothetical protein QOD39_5332 [Mycobacterium sp.]|nr:hypothetical protein [Mycobacterium sp.]
MRGQNDVAKVLGCSVFEYLGQNEEAARMFSAAMTDLSTPVIRDAVATIAIGDARSVVDIGGADGAFVAQHWAGT